MNVHFLSCLCAVLLMASGAGAQSLLTSKLDSFFQAQDPGRPGIALSIEKGGRVLYRNARGLADVTTGKPLDPFADFRMASVSKQFTAMGIFLLQREGKLSLDDPIGRWLPEMPAGMGSRILIRHLLTHSSGLLDYESLIPPTQTAQVLDADVLHLLAGHDSTYFPPGSRFQYSNTGFCLLALITERASHQSFPGFIRDRIFLPLHMDSSVIYEPGRPVPRRVMGYSLDNAGRVQPSDQSVTSATKGDGGVYTSLADYDRWIRAIEAGGLLDLAGVLEGLRFPIAGSPGCFYAGGWFLLEGARPTWFHSGSTCGFSNFVIRVPGEDWTLVYFSNLADNTAPFGDILRIIQAAGGGDFSEVMAVHDLTR